MIDDTAETLLQNAAAQIRIFLIQEETGIEPLQMAENIRPDFSHNAVVSG